MVTGQYTGRNSIKLSISDICTFVCVCMSTHVYTCMCTYKCAHVTLICKCLQIVPQHKPTSSSAFEQECLASFQGSRRGPEGGPDWLVAWTPPSSAPWPQKVRGPKTCRHTFILLRPSLPALDPSEPPRTRNPPLPNQELEEEMGDLETGKKTTQ